MMHKKLTKMKGMRGMKRIKGKRAVSVIVSYVLLISLVLGMSALVYSWLKSRVDGITPQESCPDGVNLVLESYNCTNGDFINITIRNRGRFTVSGFIIKMSDSSEGIAGMYQLCKARIPSSEGCVNEITHNITPLGTDNDRFSEEFIYADKIRQVEIEPIWKDSYCDKAITKSAVKCPP